MSDLNLFINQEAANRSLSLVNKTGSGALPIMSLPLVYADVYGTTIQFVNAAGATGSYFNAQKSTASLVLGIPGDVPLAATSCSIATTSSYSCSFGLNTNELSTSLGSNRSRQYVLELQIISGSSVVSYQNPCVVYRDIQANAIYPLSISTITSASYASYALSASYAISASHSPNALSASVAQTSSYVKLPTNGFLSDDQLKLTGSVLLRNSGQTLTIRDPSSNVDVVAISNTGPGSPHITLTNSTSDFIASINSLGIQFTPSSGKFINIDTTADTYFSTSYNFGIDTSTPQQKLHVVGDILCSNLTASLMKGTASYSTNSSTASYYAGSITSASYATTATTCSGIVEGVGKVSVGGNFINSYSANITCSSADDGRFINMITGSLIYLTSSLSSTFTATIYQSGSTQITITGSGIGGADAVVRNQGGFKNTAGQFALVTVVRVPNGDFVLGGNLALNKMSIVLPTFRGIIQPAAGASDLAADWVARVVANGGSVSQSTRDAVNTFLAALNTDNLRSLIHRLNLYAGTGLAACAVPLIKDKGNALDALTNFVSGDYSEATGLTGDGSTKFISTGFLPTTHWASVSDMHTAVYIRTDSIETNNCMIGGVNIGDGPSSNYMTIKISLAANQSYSLLTGANLAIATDTTTLGLYQGSRTAGGLVFYKNGASFATNAGASGNLNAPEIKVHCVAQTGGAPEAIWTAKTLAGYSIGLGMDGTQATNYYNAWQAFQTALSRNV